MFVSTRFERNLAFLEGKVPCSKSSVEGQHQLHCGSLHDGYQPLERFFFVICDSKLIAQSFFPPHHFKNTWSLLKGFALKGARHAGNVLFTGGSRSFSFESDLYIHHLGENVLISQRPHTCINNHKSTGRAHTRRSHCMLKVHKDFQDIQTLNTKLCFFMLNQSQVVIFKLVVADQTRTRQRLR